MKTFAERLLKVTQGCRYDMHEPDEQGLSDWIIVDHLDNACCEDIRADAIEGRYQEFVVVIKPDTGLVQKFNLATLIALARLGAQYTPNLKDF